VAFLYTIDVRPVLFSHEFKTIMNSFVTPASIEALFEQAKVPSTKRPTNAKSYETLRTTVNRATWQLFNRMMDLLRMSTDSNTIRPADVYNLTRIAAFMRMPLRDDPTSRKLAAIDMQRIMNGGGGGAPVLPMAYFDPSAPETHTGGGGEPDHTNLSPSPFVRVRNALPSTFSGGDSRSRSNLKMSDLEIVQADRVSRSSRQIGQEIITEAALTALLSEYRSRITTNTLRVGDTSRKLIRKIIASNLIQMMEQKKPFATVAKGWVIAL
jgi:hypothetical protein